MPLDLFASPQRERERKKRQAAVSDSWHMEGLLSDSKVSVKEARNVSSQTVSRRSHHSIRQLAVQKKLHKAVVVFSVGGRLVSERSGSSQVSRYFRA